MSETPYMQKKDDARAALCISSFVSDFIPFLFGLSLHPLRLHISFLHPANINSGADSVWHETHVSRSTVVTRGFHVKRTEHFVEIITFMRVAFFVCTYKDNESLQM